MKTLREGWVVRLTIRLVALFYAYGASVHLLNMASLTGFHWPSAPLKWQVLDVVYLLLDIVVAIGFWRGWRLAYVAFYIAAASQILLYTVFRQWIMDVPAAFAVTAEQMGYLDGLVVFHVVTIVLVTACLEVARRRTPPDSSRISDLASCDRDHTPSVKKSKSPPIT